MFLQFIGVNEKIVNLNAIALIEDVSTEAEPAAKVTTVAGDEFILTGDDADVLFDRTDLMIQATDAQIAQLQAATQQHATL